jgi:serine/threonine protein kinase
LSRAIFFGKILSAVAFLHANGFIHRDLKPENILVESFHPPKLKLSDWGCVSNDDKILYDRPGTIPYLAPEQVEGEYHGSPVDDWACGLIGYELLSKERTRTRVLRGPPVDLMHDKLRKFECEVALMPFCCRRLLHPNAEDRMSAEGALNVFIVRGEDAIRDALNERESDDPGDHAGPSSKRMKREH